MLSGRNKKPIRPVRKGLITASDGEDFESLWTGFAAALKDIHERNASKLSFEELYRTVYRLVIKRKADPLYDKVVAFENNWLSTHVKPQFLALVDVGVLANMGSSLASKIERRSNGEIFLKGMKTAWEDHLTTMRMTTDILLYMDKVYTQEGRRSSIYVTAMGLFRDSILLAVLDSSVPSTDMKSIYSLLHSILLDQIQMEREGDTVDKTLIKCSIQMLDGLYQTNEEHESQKLYYTLFEHQYLLESETFYRSEADQMISTIDAPSYLRHVKKRLVEEQDRCSLVLLPSTASKIREVVEETLLRGKLDQVLQLQGSGLDFMFENERYDDLALVYELASMIDKDKTLLKTALQRRLLAQGKAINDTIAQTMAAISAKKPSKPDPTKPSESKEDRSKELNAASQHTKAAIQWVDQILAIKSTFDVVCRNCFQNDDGIAQTISKCFTEFINSQTRCAEYISLYIDHNLKIGLKDKTSDDVDAVLASAITVVQFVTDKDMFEQQYKQHLSRRLIQSKSVGIDTEKQMISMLKKKFGSAFTHKMEIMFKDIALSEDLTAQYKKRAADSGIDALSQADVGVSILTSAQWPIGNILSTTRTSRAEEQTLRTVLHLPPIVERARAGFENFYLQQYTGRRLNWQGSLGTADIRAFYPSLDADGQPKNSGEGKTYQVNVPTYGMIILEQFNKLADSSQSLSLLEILDATQVPREDLVRNLHSLTLAPKTRFLKKSPDTKTLSDTDRFSINEAFKSNFVKIKVGLAIAATRVEGEKDQRDTQEKLNQTRGILIEAAIVRIMKSRQSLSHQHLVTEVIDQVKGRFKPEVGMIKAKIESLIEREYLNREGGAVGANAVYIYVA